MLKRLVGQAFYCFLDEYSEYNKITVNLEDHETNLFTSPFGIFAYRIMLFDYAMPLKSFKVHARNLLIFN